ncbi:thiol-activated cytolysin family protein [Paenibacillus sp. L3-i20]|uniref:thiol-activated cytolysin family protein n=1 Tax=Paenibacillus sp. L3-i20 TaxID=2905833 RepID=UPI001EE147C4|nr:thiol-activated cytolysin family protein [Paenibacillus sp. L3-i20]GKU80501.1 alveolysin [Paenibacillus sp. L3-i20]
MKVRNHARIIKLIAIVSVIFATVHFPVTSYAETVNSSLVSETSNSNDINTGIANLDYNNNDILAVSGDEIASFVPKEGMNSNGKFVVVERNKKSLSTSPIDISIIDSMANRTFPGALQLANQSFAENKPSILLAPRKPLTISIDLPGLKNENSITVNSPTYGNVSGAVDELVSQWSDKYSATHTLPARLQYAESMVYSKSQIGSTLSVNANYLDSTLGIDFNAIASGEKKVMVAAYKQIFYTVNAELPNDPSDLFDASVTFNDLQRKGVSDQSPPVMVSNVAYGRTIYVKLETTSKSKDVQAAFKALLQNTANAEAKSEYKNIFEDSSFTAVVLGGDSQKHNKVVTKDFSEIRNIIKDNAEFSLKNPAYPISYTSVFLKDNAIAAVHNNTDYIETTATEYSKGKISLGHYGWYVAQFDVSWDEVSYDEKGEEVLTHRKWEGSNQDRTAPFTTVIPLPPNAKNIRIFAKEATGLAWEWWRTVIDEYNVPLSSEIKVEIGGTTLNPTGGITFN